MGDAVSTVVEALEHHEVRAMVAGAVGSTPRKPEQSDGGSGI
jgi:hypothetical protein